MQDNETLVALFEGDANTLTDWMDEKQPRVKKVSKRAQKKAEQEALWAKIFSALDPEKAALARKLKDQTVKISFSQDAPIISKLQEEGNVTCSYLDFSDVIERAIKKHIRSKALLNTDVTCGEKDIFITKVIGGK